MRIANRHERRLSAAAGEVGALLDRLGGPDDALWPSQRWPTIHFPDGLHEGAHGGHGPIRYTVAEHRPARLVRFRFAAPPGLHGEHRFEVHEKDGATLLRHVIDGRATGSMLLRWSLLIRPLHDALIEDALDRAEAKLADQPWVPRPLSLRVRLLRLAIRDLRRRSQPAAAV